MKKFWKTTKQLNPTEITIRDCADLICSMCPVKVFYNDILVWDDDIDPIDWFYEIVNKNILISKITFQIVHFHHSNVYIYTR